MELEIVFRADWTAMGAIEPRPLMRLPASELWVHHTVTPASSDPVADARRVEEIGLERFGMLSYSFLVHPSGVLLEGQGVFKGAHTKDHNSRSFGVAAIGNFEHDTANENLLDTYARLTRWLTGSVGVLQPGSYPTGGHRDLVATACQSARLFERLDDIISGVDAIDKRIHSPMRPSVEGHRGLHVVALQSFLKDLGFVVGQVDRFYGGMTEAAVK